MKIGHIRLRALTPSRTFGVDIPLKDGLNVIRADNTSGKSTCLMAVVYCLGLERSLGPNLNVPLPYAMRRRFRCREKAVHMSKCFSHTSWSRSQTVVVKCFVFVVMWKEVQAGNSYRRGLGAR